MHEQDNQAVIIDQDGERGVILGLDSKTQQYRVEHEGRVFLVPSDLLTAIGQSYFSLPASFKLLARQEGQEGQDEDALVVPVIEEQLVLDKRLVDTGAVRVHLTVSEREVVVDEPTLEDRVDIERVAINQPLDKPVSPRVEGDVTIIPVMKEVLMVRKQLVLVEEIRLTTRRETVRRPQSVLLRSEEASVEHIEAQAAMPSPATERNLEQGER